VRLDLLGEVPLDSAVRESILRRQLLMEMLPGTPAAVGLSAVAGKVMDL
jgi:flagellar biosynthesis protein FlhG